jgi:release factor glutamine methyltransferase
MDHHLGSRVGPARADLAAVVARLRGAGCVFAEEEAALLIAEAGSADELEAMVARRVEGLPLEQVVGWAEFCGLRIAVEPGVFVPRRRTSLLVSEAARLASSGAVVLDLCCGSGAIGVAVASALGGVDLHAVDVDPVAVRCARRNVEPMGGTVYEGDLDAPVPESLRGRVDLVLACPPYVPTSSLRLMPTEAREHEPRVALDGGADGLDVVRRLVLVAAEWLMPGGHLLVESSEPQTEPTVALFERHGLAARVTSSDELGATVVVGQAGNACRSR